MADDLLQNLEGIYAIDPTEEELAAGIKKQTQNLDTPTYAMPGFDRYSYAARDYGALPSMYELYLSGGFPEETTDIAPADTTPVSTTVGTESGGSGITPDTSNTSFEQNLIDQGVGVQDTTYDPVVAPGEIPVTQEEMDAFNQEPVTQPMTGGVTGDDIEVGIPDSETDFVDPLGTISGAPVVSKQLQDKGPTMGTVDVTKSFVDQPEPLSDVELAEQGFLPAISDVQVEGGLSTIDEERLANYKPSTEVTQEQEGILQNIIGQAGQTVEGAMNQLSKIPGAVADFANQTVDIFGKKFNVGKTLAMGAINKLAGGPISLVFDALGTTLPKDSPTDAFKREYNIGGDFYKDIVEDSPDPNLEKRLEGYHDALQAGNLEQDPFGINTVSAFGDYDKYATDTFNELTEKAKQRAVEGKELTQFDKDRLEYYGHVSGLTGKTNVPGTPIMIDDAKTSGQLLDKIMEEQKAKKELAKLTGDLGALETATGIPSAQEEEMLAELAREEEERAARAKEEAAQRAREEAAERAAAEQRAAEAARQAEQDRQRREADARAASAARAAQAARDRAAAEAAARARDRHGGGNQGGGSGAVSTGAGRNPWSR